MRALTSEQHSLAEVLLALKSKSAKRGKDKNKMFLLFECLPQQHKVHTSAGSSTRPQLAFHL